MGSIFRRNHPSGHRSARFRHHHPVRNQIPGQRPMKHRIRLGRSAIQRIRHANRNHRSRRNRHRLGHRGRRRRGSRRHHLHRLLSRSSGGRGWRRRRRRVVRHYLLMPSLRLWLRRRHWLSRPGWSHHQVIHDRSDPIHRGAVRRSQRTGSVIVYLPIQGSHTVGHRHLNVLPRQSRLTRDLCLDVAANLLIVPHRGRRRLRGRGGRGRSLLCILGRGALTSRPRYQQSGEHYQRDTASAYTFNPHGRNPQRF